MGEGEPDAPKATAPASGPSIHDHVKPPSDPTVSRLPCRTIPTRKPERRRRQRVEPSPASRDLVEQEVGADPDRRSRATATTTVTIVLRILSTGSPDTSTTTNAADDAARTRSGMLLQPDSASGGRPSSAASVLVYPERRRAVRCRCVRWSPPVVPPCRSPKCDRGTDTVVPVPRLGVITDLLFAGRSGRGSLAARRPRCVGCLCSGDVTVHERRAPRQNVPEPTAAGIRSEPSKRDSFDAVQDLQEPLLERLVHARVLTLGCRQEARQAAVELRLLVLTLLGVVGRSPCTSALPSWPGPR